VYGTERATREIAVLLREIYPSATNQEVKIVRELVDGRAISLGFGAIGTLLSAGAIFGTLDSAVAAVLGREGKRALVRGKVAGFGFAAAIALMAVGSFAVSFGVAAAGNLLSQAGFRDTVRLALEIVSPLVGVAVGFVFFYLVYRLVPRRAVRRHDARTAALVSAVLWELAKVAFGYLTRALGVFQAYGVLAFAAGLLTWIYVTAIIILIGAEVIKTKGPPERAA
jgi:membrane protein